MRSVGTRSRIDCKYYNFGEGTCPFGSSCFYAHVNRDGRREEVRCRLPPPYRRATRAEVDARARPHVAQSDRLGGGSPGAGGA